MLIDVHTHPLPDEYIRAVGGGDDRELDGVVVAPWSAATQLETMDAHGIDAGLLSLPELADRLTGASGRHTARQLNELMAGLVQDHPLRLGAFAIVPMDDMDAANAEMAYALDELGLDGVTASPHRHAVYLGDSSYDPWFEEMNRRGVTLFVHPGRPEYFDPKNSRMNVSVLEFMFETTRMATSMVLSGAKSRFPDVNVIAPHGGGTIPYLAHRISLVAQMPWAFRDGAHLSVEEVRAAFGTFHYDLTASTSTEQLDALRSIASADRFLLGTDFPLMPAATIDPALADLSAYTGFDDVEKAAILGGNLAELFPRFAGSPA